MIIFITGLPNSGKSYFTKNIKNCIHLDNYIVDGYHGNHPHKDIDDMLKQYQNVFIEGILPMPGQRKIFFHKYFKHNIICVYLDTDKDIIFSRNTRYTKEVLQQFFNCFNPPQLNEGYLSLVTIKNNDEQMMNELLKYAEY